MKYASKWFLFICLIWAIACPISGRCIEPSPYKVCSDSVQARMFSSRLIEHQSKLNYPKTTSRLYQTISYKSVWFNQADKNILLTNAVVLIDCVLQYGLKKSDYHPAELSFTKLVAIEDQKNDHLGDKASFDIFLTDAIITFIQQLHFGFANPYISVKQTDDAGYSGFRADHVLHQALKGKFSDIILNVQPKHTGYRALQNYMRLVTGQYSGDCYEFNNDSLKLMALNMERYRWHTKLYEEPYVEINIPTYLLRFQNKGMVRLFKVIVGKPTSKTPQLSSKIYSVSTSPEWNVPHGIFINELLPVMLQDPSYAKRNHYEIYTADGKRVYPSMANLKYIRGHPSGYSLKQSYGEGNSLGQIVFHFANAYRVHLHDTPNRSLFNKSARALSHGCIRIDNPRLFAAELLVAAGTPVDVYNKVLKYMDSYKPYSFNLIKPVPIIINYITCAIEDGELRKYADPYNLDKAMLNRLFHKVNFSPITEMTEN